MLVLNVRVSTLEVAGLTVIHGSALVSLKFIEVPWLITCLLGLVVITLFLYHLAKALLLLPHSIRSILINDHSIRLVANSGSIEASLHRTLYLTQLLTILEFGLANKTGLRQRFTFPCSRVLLVAGALAEPQRKQLAAYLSYHNGQDD